MPNDDTVPSMRQFLVRQHTKSGIGRKTDLVAIEEPLEIRISYSFKQVRRTEHAAVTMRTPGNEKELAMGFLLSEGLIARREDVIDVRLLGDSGRNELLVELAPDVDIERWHLARATLMNSACGLCGKKTIEQIAKADRVEECSFTVSADLVYRLPSLLEPSQSGFSKTGGLHAAAIVSAEGELHSVFEDVGRHNALDKLIGNCLLSGLLPLQRKLIVMTSRASFEVVQKALAARCEMLVTIGAPSSLAIDFARDRGITLAGFVRDTRFNVYSGEWRIR
jgi:FdhD protein